MYIEPFGVEQWMNKWETKVVANLAETCVDSLSAGALLDMSGRREEITRQMMDLRLSYGDILGSEELLGAIASMYESVERENVIVMNGGSAANFIAMFTLIEPGEEVICAYPTYQQLYSIPRAFGASVKLLRLRFENNFLPDVDELKKLVTPKTKLIIINNSNNPTGSLMTRAMLEETVQVAKSAGAWLYCDEAYRLLAHDGVCAPSIADMYEKGIVSCSLSKSFSLAGLRLGWIVGPRDFINEAVNRRDYTTISCGRIDDLLGRVAIQCKEKILSRNLGIIRACANVLDEWVKSEPRISYVKPQSGTTAFLQYDYDISSEDFCLRLILRDGTFLLPGKCFGPEFDRFLRIGYAYEPQALKAGLDRVSGFLGELEKGL